MRSGRGQVDQKLGLIVAVHASYLEIQTVARRNNKVLVIGNEFQPSIALHDAR